MHPNLDLIDRFFAAYASRDIDALRAVTAEDITWEFPGHNPFSGVHRGLDAVVRFFDTMGAVMGLSNPQVEKLVSAENDAFVAEVQHIITHRDDGHNLEQHWCVLWRFEGGKIAGGRHLASDQVAADAFFNAAASSK